MDYEAGKLIWFESISNSLAGLPDGLTCGIPLPLTRKELRKMVGCCVPIGDELAAMIGEDRGTTYDQLATRDLNRKHPNWREVKDCDCGGELEPDGKPYSIDLQLRMTVGQPKPSDKSTLVRNYKCKSCGHERELRVQ